MVFKGFADGCEPAEPVFPGNPGVVDAELVAGQAQSVFLGPGRDFGDTFAKALFIPSLFPVIPDDTLRKLVPGRLQRESPASRPRVVPQRSRPTLRHGHEARRTVPVPMAPYQSRALARDRC